MKLYNILREAIKIDPYNILWFHGSNSKIDTPKAIVHEFEGYEGGFFVSSSDAFARRWGKYLHIFTVKEGAKIFDFTIEEHQDQLIRIMMKYYPIPNLDFEDYKNLTFDTGKYMFSLLRKAFPKQWKQYEKHYNPNARRPPDIDDDPYDYDDTPPSKNDWVYTQMENESSTTYNNFFGYMRNNIIPKNHIGWSEIEKKGWYIKTLGYDAAYIQESKTINLHVYDPDILTLQKITT